MKKLEEIIESIMCGDDRWCCLNEQVSYGTTSMSVLTFITTLLRRFGYERTRALVRMAVRTLSGSGGPGDRAALPQGPGATAGSPLSSDGSGMVLMGQFWTPLVLGSTELCRIGSTMTHPIGAAPGLGGSTLAGATPNAGSRHPWSAIYARPERGVLSRTPSFQAGGAPWPAYKTPP